MPAPTRSCVAATAAGTLAMLVGSTLLAAPASADRTFHTTRFELSSVAGAPLRSGFVIDIHAEGPRIYAQERYHLSGALPGTAYEVVLHIFRSLDCQGPQVAALPTDSFVTNRAGNGHGSATFRPADAAGLAAQQDEYGLVWNVVVKGGAVAYTTGCQVVALD